MINFLRPLAPRLKLAVQAAALAVAAVFGSTAHADLLTLNYSGYVSAYDAEGKATKVSGYLFIDTSRAAEIFHDYEGGEIMAYPINFTQSRAYNTFGDSDPVSFFTGETLPDDSPGVWRSYGGYMPYLWQWGNGFYTVQTVYINGQPTATYNMFLEGAYGPGIWERVQFRPIYTSGESTLGDITSSTAFTRVSYYDLLWGYGTTNLDHSIVPPPQMSVYDMVPSTVSAVPEPASWALVLASLGAAGVAGARRRKARREDTVVA